MELIRSASRRTRLSEAIYLGLNLLFAGSVVLLAILFDPPYVAYALVLLSKWRVFAVRPRYWFANLQANIVDVVVGLSIVTLIWQGKGFVSAQILLGILYAGWLVAIKPRSRRKWVVVQARISLFLGLTALFSYAYAWPSALVVAAAWLVGYVTSRHAMGSYDEDELTFMSITWGLVVAELAWVGYHWTVAYDISRGYALKVPQVAIIVSLLSFLVMKLYDSHYHNDGRIKWQEVKMPAIFSVVIIGMLLVFFTGVSL